MCGSMATFPPNGTYVDAAGVAAAAVKLLAFRGLGALSVDVVFI